MLGKFTTHIPPQILESNPYALRMATMLDEMVAIREQEIARYEERFHPSLIYDIKTLRKYIDDFKGEYLLTTSRASLECLYFHKYDIFSQKGTAKGLERLLKCLAGAEDVTVTYLLPPPLISFSTLDDSVLPNGQDIFDELDGATAFNPPKWVATLLGDSWLPYYGAMTVDIHTIGITLSPTFLAWVLDLLPNYLAGIDPDSTTITLTNTVT